MKVRQRVTGGFAVLLTLFVTLVIVQLVTGDRLRASHVTTARDIARVRELNRDALQNMTDAETAVRGFQLTGDKSFLAPYAGGRAGAYAAFEQLWTDATDDEVRRLLSVERSKTADWLYSYAIPIVSSGKPDTNAARVARGREMFDEIRTANAAVSAAIEAQQRLADARATRDARVADLVFAVLAGLILVTGLVTAMLHEKHVMAPLEHIRGTLRRLSGGDLSARVAPSGPAEMRAVADSVNDLAERTEHLIAAEQARAAGSELVQAVAAELKAERELAVTGAKIAELAGLAFGAETAHVRIVADADAEAAISWPATALWLAGGTVREIGAARPGAAFTLPESDAVAVSLGDAGLICLVRRDRPEWTEEEQRLLVALAGEIDHAVRQERLRRQQDRLIGDLRVLDQQKDVFVSTVTHELRTPLTSILGYTEMVLDEDDVPDAHRRSLAVVLRNAHRLQATVGDLLLLDRSAVRDAEALPVDLAELASGLHHDLDAAARAKDLRSHLDCEPAWVRGDGPQLKRAIRYLMENAIKFTPSGGRLECRLTATDRHVTVAITDTGIGIPEADVPGLFTPFHRAANAMDQAVQGPGLGLAIVRDIVTGHGGTVAARSELGRGSTFTMTLPALAGQ
ncbi:HAMP domain-containing protein [Actinoplanes sp. TBRC 11911]|uniref:sensor histidine kinase n=1 Tax=Actinoplanes sp. TBRC 11911 TaxID=2729386 RepID=UPI00145D1D59|nr:ATP-binding protein [Actinoplanes sp. TBRC 11911]NMO51555.1 HAMP domain-containing protein [Actinoplanes sp. TBRC 11911]